jgi:hypothetical protein
MKNIVNLFGIITLAVIIGFSTAACGGGDDNDPLDLPGTIVITPNTDIEVGTELTATYTAAGNETITGWQWKLGPTVVGSNSNKFTPNTAGPYTVTVSAKGYKPKTSNTVTVINSSLPGTVSISPGGHVNVNTTLTAEYTPGTDGTTGTLSYIWKRNGLTLSNYSKEYTPIQAGVYTVTISKTGYSGKTSDPVFVRTTSMQLTSDKWLEIITEIRYGDTDGILDLSEYTCSDNATESPGLNSSGVMSANDNFSFDYDDAKKRIVKIILPDAATSIEARSSSFESFYLFKNLEEISGKNITVLNNQALASLDKLVTVNFPKLETVGERAFDSADITEVNFPLVTSVGRRAFSFCTRIETVEFPETTSIGDSAFLGCTSLKTVDFPKTATIGTTIFGNCSNLEDVTIGKIQEIGINTFFYPATYASPDTALVNLKTVNLPEVTNIKEKTFYRCVSLTSVTIPKVTFIGKSAFEGCTALGSADLPEVMSIDGDAFRDCTSLASVILSSVQELGYGVFYRCTNLIEMALPELDKLNGYAFYNCTNLERVTFSKVTELAHYTFQGCTKLTDITLGTIAPKMGNFCFVDITSPRTITVKIPNGATGYDEAGTTFPKTYNELGSSSMAKNWANGLRGGGWDGTNFSITSGYNISYYINNNITIIITN